MNSSAIEGDFLDPDQVRSSIARRLGLEIGGLVETNRDVENIVEMMLNATQRYSEVLTSERLFGWHSALFTSERSGMLKINVGTWQASETDPMQVVSGPIGRQKIHFEAPSAANLQFEMSRSLDWIESNQNLDPVLKAGIAHLWFVTVHPFEDGNGRVGRAIIDLLLSRAENSSDRYYSMSSQIEAERKDYYLHLEHCQRGSLDITSG